MQNGLTEEKEIGMKGGYTIYRQNYILDSYITGYIDYLIVKNCLFSLTLHLDEEFRNQGLAIKTLDVEPFFVKKIQHENPTVFWYDINEQVGRVWDYSVNIPRPYARGCSGAREAYIFPSL